jgi:FkbM family methyltransferase
MKMFKKIIKSGDLVFDVGLNKGDKSVLFLELGANVIGFEPQVECFNYANNRFNDNNKFKSENIALDNKKGIGTIFIGTHNELSSMSNVFISETKKERFTDYNWSDNRQINTDTLDNMISKYGKPNFIKIDVEGYEIEVLKGLSSQIDFISIEFVPELCNNTIECIEYVDKLNDGNTLFNYVYRNDSDFKYDEWINKEELIEYLLSVKDFRFEFGDVYTKRTFK